ncbi:MAG: response regulator transcription factor [Phycisphaerales bacterium]
MRILVVEDSAKIRESVAQALREAGYAVDAVADGRQGFIHVQTSEYDVVILDLGLPEMDGLTVLRRMREKSIATPVLVLTARDAIDDRVLGLRSGADDYVVKPFALAELLARVAALSRRRHGAASSLLVVGDLEIDTVARTVRTRGGRSLELAPREYRVLEYLALRAEKPVSRLELEDHVYDERAAVMSNAIDSAICSLRAKLEVAGCAGLIRTRRKVGYVLGEREPR